MKLVPSTYSSARRPCLMKCNEIPKNPSSHAQLLDRKSSSREQRNRSRINEKTDKNSTTRAPITGKRERERNLVSGAYRLLVRSCEGDGGRTPPVEREEAEPEPHGRDILEGRGVPAGAGSEERREAQGGRRRPRRRRRGGGAPAEGQAGGGVGGAEARVSEQQGLHRHAHPLRTTERERERRRV